jgi:7-cyano-7-deazaguanine reductase
MATDTRKHLGRPSAMPAEPEPGLLDRVANPHPGTTYLVRFTSA